MGSINNFESQLIDEQKTLIDIQSTQQNLESEQLDQELFVENHVYTFNKSITFGKITTDIEKVKLIKNYIFFGSNITVHATSKKIIGISLIDKWKNGTNGQISIVKKKDITIITCTSQILRGHKWDIVIFY